jgi:hypothetical protein
LDQTEKEITSVALNGNKSNGGTVRLSYNPYFSAFFFAGTIFVSYTKSANSTFSHAFSGKRTGSILNMIHSGAERSREKGLPHKHKPNFSISEQDE